MDISPFPITLPLPDRFTDGKTVLALGGELKSSICLIRNGEALLTQALGDLEQEPVLRGFHASVDAVLATPDLELDAIAIDLHPDYLSAQYGERLANELGIPLIRVQHHYAHIASVMADNQLPHAAKPLLGIALDGLGFGEDGTIWGGEFLLADYRTFKRLGRFAPVPMIGGAAAIHEPWRNTLAHLLPIWNQVNSCFGDLEMIRYLNSKPATLLQRLATSGTHAPLASSCGRLFDAMAALLGLHADRVDFEAQAAMALEQAATARFANEQQSYAVTLQRVDGLLQPQWQQMWLEVLQDIQNGTDAGIIAARFHRTLIAMLAETSARLCGEHGLDTVALSGGVFRNRLISNHLPETLQDQGLNVLQHRNVATHDGGISLGQAVVALKKTLG